MAKIFTEIKESLNLYDEDAFDSELLVVINSSLSIVNQQGVGNSINITSEDKLDWNDFFKEDEPDLIKNMVKQYVKLKTQIFFDNPPPSVIKYHDDAAKELLWRIREEVL